MKIIYYSLFIIILFICILFLLYEYIKYEIINKKIYFYKNFDKIYDEKYKDNNIFINKLSSDHKYFIKNFEEHIKNQLSFFGSIIRSDFNQKHSDIDATIFIDIHADKSIYIDKILYYFQNNKIKNDKNIIVKIFNIKLQNLDGILINYKSNKIKFDLSLYDIKLKRKILINSLQKGYTIHPMQSKIINILRYLTNEKKIIDIEYYCEIKNKLLSIGYFEIFNVFKKEKIYEINI
jgi:hypothetical protein